MVLGSFQYFASSEAPRLKLKKLMMLFIIGSILPRLKRFMKMNWENLPSKKPSVKDMPCCKYFQSWSPIIKFEPKYRKIRFRVRKLVRKETKKGVFTFCFMIGKKVVISKFWIFCSILFMGLG